MSRRPKLQRMGAYALVLDGDRILLCRLSGGLSGGRWTLPGGGVEYGEHPKDAALREVMEETGLAVEIGELRKVDSHLSEALHAQYHNVAFIYSCEVVGGSLRAELKGSTDAVQWFTFEEASSLPKVELAETGIALALQILERT